MSPGLANLIGCSLILCNAISQGLVAVMTRMMQSIHWSVILFYYSVVALVATSIVYSVTNLTTRDGNMLSVFQYDGEQFLWILITAVFILISLVAKTISNQNEKSGLITMFSYIGIVYACLGDILIFDQVLNWLEWLGVCTIAISTVSLTLYLLIFKQAKKT